MCSTHLLQQLQPTRFRTNPLVVVGPAATRRAPRLRAAVAAATERTHCLRFIYMKGLVLDEAAIRPREGCRHRLTGEELVERRCDVVVRRRDVRLVHCRLVID